MKIGAPNGSAVPISDALGDYESSLMSLDKDQRTIMSENSRLMFVATIITRDQTFRNN